MGYRQYFMPTFEEFEAWAKSKGGQVGLVKAFQTELGVKIGQPAISAWFSKRRVPEERREQVEKLGWNGPWEWPIEPSPDSDDEGIHTEAVTLVEETPALRALPADKKAEAIRVFMRLLSLDKAKGQAGRTREDLKALVTLTLAGAIRSPEG